MELHAPLDYERLPEFWQLCDALRGRSHPPLSARALEQSATFLWWRLWITLGYQAQSTNRPGWLNAAGARRFQQSLEPLFGDDCPAVEVLAEGAPALLVRLEGEEWECPLFKRHNAHLAGNHLPPHIKGNIRSRLNAARPGIAQNAMHQALLLPPEVFQDRDGKEIAPGEVNRAMILILTLDRCLQAPPRNKGNYTPGLMADAVSVLRKEIPKESLDSFYYWVAENRANAALPKTAEEILQEFERLYPPPKE